MKKKISNIAVFASGNGTNYEAIARACQDGIIPAKVVLLVCDHPNAYVLTRANKFGTPVFAFCPKDYSGKVQYESVIADMMDQYQVDLVCLAGYMRLIGEVLLTRYQSRIINIHPSLLPAFKGKDAVERAMASGVKEYGVTVHFVDAGLDSGKIIAQRTYYYEGKDVEEAHRLGQDIEHTLYIEAIRQVLNMKTVLVVGGGGREHAIVDALNRSSQVGKIYCAPGNAGIADLAECVDIKVTEVGRLKDFASENGIDMTVVGPEAALAEGIVDEFRKTGLKIFGHTKSATRIESSKEFAKKLMAKYGIPTAAYKSFSAYEEALDYVKTHSFPTVLKYDGLAAGKGVVIARTVDEADEALKNMLLDKSFGKDRVVIEEYLEGSEFSFMCFVNGRNLLPMPLAQDHKRAYDGDKGPNTGGMGAYTGLNFISDSDRDYAFREIMQKTAAAMADEGCPLTGVLYGGLMKTKDSIKVIEFNARFGDPETEVVLPLLETDILPLFMFDFSAVSWSKDCSMGVVMASKGYPGSYEKGFEIDGLENVSVKIYHMGTKKDADNVLKTDGGRVLMLTACGTDMKKLQEQVYQELKKVKCQNLFYRTDIAHQVFDDNKPNKNF